MSRNSINRWVREGRLTEGRAQRGSLREVLVYDPNELARMPRRKSLSMTMAEYEGELSGRVFEMLSDGKNVADIVIATREVPSKIEELRWQWIEATGGGLPVIGRAAFAELSRLLCAPVATVDELIERVRAMAPKIEAEAPDDATDAEIERGITRALDVAGAP